MQEARSSRAKNPDARVGELMGYRFRRSIKLLPGVRVNVGLRRSSLSIGGHGATLNLSSRGTRSTFGLPGTGVSWTSSSSRGRSRGPTARQIAAAQRRIEAEERYHAAVAEVEANEAESRDLVNCWRDFAPALTNADYDQMCLERPYTHEGPVPPVPDEVRDGEALRELVTKRARQEIAKKTAPITLLIVLGLIASFFAAAADLLPVAGTLLFLVLVVTGGVSAWLQRRTARQMATKMFDAEWPRHVEGLRAARVEYERLLAEWPAKERIRIESTRRLISGEREALEESVSDSLQELDFPFEALCRVEVPDPMTAFVLVDLPEIENVIPETKRRALKNGTVKEVRRTKAERNQAYLTLVTGLALWIVRTVFAAGPTLEAVHLAAYTQRRKRASGRITDDYVYEVECSRSEAAVWDPRMVDPITAITKVRNRLDLRDSGELKGISQPSWAEDVATDSA